MNCAGINIIHPALRIDGPSEPIEYFLRDHLRKMLNKGPCALSEALNIGVPTMLAMRDCSPHAAMCLSGKGDWLEALQATKWLLYLLCCHDQGT